MKTRHRTALFGIPSFLLASSFLIICIHFHTANPWHAVVHEDGQRTLLATIFYFEHALGELPEELILAAATAGIALLFIRPPEPKRRLGWIAGVGALSTDATIFIGSCATVGLHGSLSWLLQYHTRTGAPLQFGSHWRYHLLSEASLMLLPALLAESMWAASQKKSRVWIVSWVAFGACCIIFGINAAPFRDPAYLGHQVRESFTHALVTIPLALGALAMTQTYQPTRPRFHMSWRLLACIGLLAYQVIGALATSATQSAQTHDLVKLVCAHFFEHTFSYLVVPLHALSFFLLFGRSEAAA